jgi:hypothetical protein
LLLSGANGGRGSRSGGGANFGPGLQPDIYSGNLGALISKNRYKSGLKLPKLCSDRAVSCVDDDFPQPQIGDA